LASGDGIISLKGVWQDSLVRDDSVSKIDELLRQLDASCRSDVGPFPYAGCRRLLAAGGGRDDGLIPDLDMYLGEIAGYRSWGKKILQWPDEKIQTVERRLQQSFLDRFTVYAELEPVLSSLDVPDVRDALFKADRTRAALQELLSAIRAARL
jgi:hypothetical protein